MRGKFGVFATWHEARENAVQISQWGSGLDVAIRKSPLYAGGPLGFQVKLASRGDSDYALAELVRANSVI